MKTLLTISLLLFFIFGSSSHVQEIRENQLKLVVIDAGHGGKDPGCIGLDRKTYEKDIALEIALKLGKLIEDSLSDVTVIYTRKSDQFIPLWERAHIANKNNADLFISVHCNANHSHTPQGTETYVMGLHKSKGNLEVSKRENKSILLEENNVEQYDDFDPDSDESYIVLSLIQNAYRKQSLELASTLQTKIEQRKIRKNLGVKEAGFLVLWKTTMPSILVETGFLTNPDDKQFLKSETGKNELAYSIYDSVKELKMKWEQ